MKGADDKLESLNFEFSFGPIPHHDGVSQIDALDEKAIEISFFKFNFMKIRLDFQLLKFIRKPD